MRIVTTSLRQVFDMNQVPFADRSQLTVLAVAKAIAFHLPLPTSPVDSLPSYYGNTHQSFVNLALGGVNEAIVLDVDLATEMVYKLYKLRYLMVFDATSIDSIKVFEAVASENNRVIPTGLAQLSSTYAYGGAVLAHLIRAVGDDLEYSGVFKNVNGR